MAFSWMKSLMHHGNLEYKRTGRPCSRLHESRHPALTQLRELLLAGFRADDGKDFPYPNLPWAYNHEQKIEEVVHSMGISTPQYAWTLLKEFFPDLTTHKAGLKHPREQEQAQLTAKRVLGLMPLPMPDSLLFFKADGYGKKATMPQVAYWRNRSPVFHYNPDLLLNQIFIDGLTVQPDRSAKNMRSIGVKGQPPAASPCKLAHMKVLPLLTCT